MARNWSSAIVKICLLASLVFQIGCESSRAIKISDVTFEPSSQGLIILETSSRIQGLATSNWLNLQQFNPETGQSASLVRSGQFHLSGTGGRFIVAKVPAGFHVVRSYIGVNGTFCYDVASYGVRVEPGAITFMGMLDSRQVQKDATSAATTFYRRESVSPGSPQNRDRIVYTLTQNYTPIDSVTMTREFYEQTFEPPFAHYSGAEHTYRVTTKLFTTSLIPPRITAPTEAGLLAARQYLKEKRPDITQEVTFGELIAVEPALEETACAAKSITVADQESKS
jgi:hypothetical protein